jgi:sialate O-acetylesterase
MKAENDKAIISFDCIGSGLVAADGKPLRGFYISADGKAFVPGTAEIVDSSVIVTSSNVRTPVAVRYGAEVDMGKENLDVNLANQEGLPASPFTAGSVH